MTRKKKIYDLIVTGAGASGMAAAITAADRGLSVLVLEHKKEAAKKILSTGNGRCNFTNQKQGRGCYRSCDPAFVIPDFFQDSGKTLTFFREQLHLIPAERNGYYYPRSMQASSVRNALLAAAAKQGVVLKTDVGIRSIQKKGSVFSFDTRQGEFLSRCCLLACGGKAAPKTGSDGSGYIYARQLGHSIEKPLPALVPLLADMKKSSWLREAAGVRCPGKISLYVDGTYAGEDTGELQLTDYGISGIPVFQVSRFASLGLSRGKNVQAVIDFVPEYKKKDLTVILRKFLEDSPDTDSDRTEENVKAAVNGFLNQKLSAALLKHSWHSFRKDTAALAKAMKHTEISVIGTKSFDKAQVTCGGVCLHEVDLHTMESKITQGLYFAGEMLDVDGICGGYNLQWAWTSGMMAGKSAAESLKGGKGFE